MAMSPVRASGPVRMGDTRNMVRGSSRDGNESSDDKRQRNGDQPDRARRAAAALDETGPLDPATEPTDDTRAFAPGDLPGSVRPPGAPDLDDAPEPGRRRPRFGWSFARSYGWRREPGEHRRGPGLVLPLIVFVSLLLGAIAIGRFVVPADVPQAGAPPRSGPSDQGTVAPGSGGPQLSGLPVLPTAPPRPADALAGWAGRVSAVTDVPLVAVQAYGYAQLLVRQNDPTCGLTWTTLAGIGKVESTHGQAGGAVLQEAGRSSPAITGPLLDGRGGRALVRDTDAGAFDGNATYDRAMGPLRLMPRVWREQAIDADADGILDPYDIDDATLALARLLCSGSDNMGERKGWDAALERYRDGASYARSVFRAADSYGKLTRNIL
jgi:hypothetical protein